MQNRTQTVLFGCALALAFGTSPAGARVGVEESASSSSRPQAAPSGSGGGGSATGSGYNENAGGFHLGSDNGDFDMVIGGRIAPRFDFINWDPTTGLNDQVSFQIRWARVYFSGHILGEQNSYYLQLAADSGDQLYTSATGNNDFQIADGWLKHSWSNQFALKAGQFKVPYGRQMLTSSGRLQFPERSLAANASGTLSAGRGFDSRDVGIELSGENNEGKFQYAFALVNGNGRNRVNLDNKIALYARLGLNPTGNYGYEEGDLETTESAATTLGAAIHYQKDDAELGSVGFTRFNVDGGIKYHGLSVQGEFFLTHVAPTGGSKFDNKAFYLQAGYFVQPKSVEIVARASRLSLEGENSDAAEYSAGFNVYTMGHKLKWQVAYAYLDEQSGVEHHRLLGQAQYWF